MKKIITVLLLLCISIFNLYKIEAFSSGVPEIGNDKYLIDDGNILSNRQARQLNKKLKKLSDKYGVDVLVYTTDNLAGLDTASYADRFYDLNGFKKDGLILLMDMENKIAHISTRGSCITLFKDSGVKYILDNMSDYLKSADYNKAINIFIESCDNILADEVDFSNPVKINNKELKLENYIFSLVISLLFSVLLIYFLRKQINNKEDTLSINNPIISDSFNIKGYSDLLVDRKAISRSFRK